jgi:hypothetical protein
VNPPGRTTTPRGSGTRCRVRLAGHLDAHWSSWFDGLSVTQHDDGTTTLHGAVADQAALHAILCKVRDLGVTLLSVLTGIDAEGCGQGTASRKD